MGFVNDKTTTNEAEKQQQQKKSNEEIFKITTTGIFELFRQKYSRRLATEIYSMWL